MATASPALVVSSAAPVTRATRAATATRVSTEGWGEDRALHETCTVQSPILAKKKYRQKNAQECFGVNKVSNFMDISISKLLPF